MNLLDSFPMPKTLRIGIKTVEGYERSSNTSTSAAPQDRYTKASGRPFLFPDPVDNSYCQT